MSDITQGVDCHAENECYRTHQKAEKNTKLLVLELKTVFDMSRSMVIFTC